MDRGLLQPRAATLHAGHAQPFELSGGTPQRPGGMITTTTPRVSEQPGELHPTPGGETGRQRREPDAHGAASAVPKTDLALTEPAARNMVMVPPRCDLPAKGNLGDAGAEGSFVELSSSAVEQAWQYLASHGHINVPSPRRAATVCAQRPTTAPKRLLSSVLPGRQRFARLAL